MLSCGAARYNLLHRTAVSFVLYYISVFSPVTDGGAPAGGGSLKRADLMPAADFTPDECFSVARYRLLHHTAVSFVSSDIRVCLLIFRHCRTQTEGSRLLQPRGPR